MTKLQNIENQLKKKSKEINELLNNIFRYLDFSYFIYFANFFVIFTKKKSKSIFLILYILLFKQKQNC